ncbi:MAG: hypothetical protein K8Q89_08420 [Nitrosarchaeum sp.]|nr:hypothetical protein [Nitrosarchaeum sp.]
MKLILEMICSGCNQGRCNEHQERTIKIDRITGLEIEAHCMCVNHTEMNNIKIDSLLNVVVCEKETKLN